MMNTFNNINLMIVNKSGNAICGRNGPRTYKTPETAQKQLDELHRYGSTDCRIVKVFYAEVL